MFVIQWETIQKMKILYNVWSKMYIRFCKHVSGHFLSRENQKHKMWQNKQNILDETWYCQCENEQLLVCVIHAVIKYNVNLYCVWKFHEGGMMTWHWQIIDVLWICLEFYSFVVLIQFDFCSDFCFGLHGLFLYVVQDINLLFRVTFTHTHTDATCYICAKLKDFFINGTLHGNMQKPIEKTLLKAQGCIMV